MWLIFTDEKKWVLELTKEGTLWYNYHFFQNFFKLMSLDVVENQHYITKWVEDTIINGVRNTDSWVGKPFVSVEYTIQNGVKYTIDTTHHKNKYVEDAIKNGVKYTGGIGNPNWMGNKVENAIQNGIKETQGCGWSNQGNAENAIKNGVKETHRDAERHPKTVEDAIQNGVKETKKGGFNQHYDMFRTIENGIKETKTPGADGDIISTLEWIKENNTVNIPKLIDDVIEKGIKYTEAAALFDETKVDRIISEGVKETKGGGYLGSIEMKGKMVHQLESPKQNNEVEEVIEHGVKLTNSSLQIDGSCVVEDVIQNGIKETHDDVYHNKGRVDGVIRNGVKEVYPAYKMIYNPMNFEPVISEEKRITDVTDVIRDGIKEVQPLPAQDGNRDWGVYYNRQEDRTKPFTEYVDDVLIEGKKI
jgi:predicted peroxiredoxin